MNSCTDTLGDSLARAVAVSFVRWWIRGALMHLWAEIYSKISVINIQFLPSLNTNIRCEPCTTEAPAQCTPRRLKMDTSKLDTLHRPYKLYTPYHDILRII